jgi:hypothetical protein
LLKFKKREGHCRVVQRFKEDDVQLGTWVSAQRSKKNKLSADQIKRLDALGFSWDIRTDQWEEGYAALLKFKKREGHCRVTQDIYENGLRLGSWLVAQRPRMKKGQLTRDQIKRLDALGFSWDPLTDQWEEGFRALQEFKKREGHCRVPAKGNNQVSLKLGAWVYQQRQKLKLNRLSIDHKKRLNALGFVWKL